MAVKTFSPAFSITVYKTRTRADSGQPSRLKGGFQTWDLTPHLGDGSEINVNKSLHGAMGSFVIQIPDQPYSVENGDTDTLYGLLEPFDEIDIRLARDPSIYANRQPPILMRGFIRMIRRMEVMSANGKPNRITVIQGHDYGCLFEITQIPPMHMLVYGLNHIAITPFEPYLLLGVNKKPYPIGQFLKLVLDNMVNVQAKLMQARFQIALQDPYKVKGIVNLPGLDSMIGPIWNTLISFSDTPWNELWLEDPYSANDQSVPTLRLRPAPYRTWIKDNHLLTEGQYIPQMDQTSSATFTDIAIKDVVRLDASRSDQDVVNLCWVQSEMDAIFQINPMLSAALSGKLGYFVLKGTEYPNSDPDLYGYRVMERTSKLISDKTDEGPEALPEEQYKDKVKTPHADWGLARRKGLVEMNCDNVLLEDGSMVVKGNEAIRAGTYVRLTRNKFKAEYYAVSVNHKFAPYRHYLTTVEFIRGTGFIERLRIQGSPCWQEGKQGVYF